MELFEVIEVFSSLSQETRLRVLKLLIECGRDGLPAGKIAEELEIPDNTLSFHLSHMSRAGLVSSQKEGRSISYFANTGLMEKLMGFMLANCCVREKSKGRRAACKEKEC